MAQALLPEGLWSLIADHLPAHRPSPKGGRPRIDDRAALNELPTDMREQATSSLGRVLGNR